MSLILLEGIPLLMFVRKCFPCCWQQLNCTSPFFSTGKYKLFYDFIQVSCITTIFLHVVPFFCLVLIILLLSLFLASRLRVSGFILFSYFIVLLTPRVLMCLLYVNKKIINIWEWYIFIVFIFNAFLHFVPTVRVILNYPKPMITILSHSWVTLDNGLMFINVKGLKVYMISLVKRKERINQRNEGILKSFKNSLK